MLSVGSNIKEPNTIMLGIIPQVAHRSTLMLNSLKFVYSSVRRVKFTNNGRLYGKAHKVNPEAGIFVRPYNTLMDIYSYGSTETEELTKVLLSDSTNNRLCS